MQSWEFKALEANMTAEPSLEAPKAMSPEVIVPYSNIEALLSVVPFPAKLNDVSATSSPLPKWTS